jgi:hypothetical protein
VITFDWRGGLALQPRIKSEPVLTIRANGTITVVDPFSNVADISGALTAEELQDLLKFMVKDHDVFGIREQEIGAAIEAEMKRMGRFFGVSDASDTVVRIQLAGQEHEASFNSVRVFAPRFPGIAALGHLLAIESRLTRIVESLRAGGASKIAAALDQANAHLKRTNPGLAPLTADDYLRTLDSGNGRRLMQFLRDQGDNTNLSVTVEYTANQEPSVRVSIQTKSPLR